MEFDKIKEIIAEQLGVSEDEIAMETTFEDLGADSLDLFQIITELEDAFDMEFATRPALIIPIKAISTTIIII